MFIGSSVHLFLNEIDGPVTLTTEIHNYDRAREQLDACDAFLDPNKADRQGIRLRLSS